MNSLKHHLAISLVIASSLFAVPRPAAASTHSHVFNTVDAVEMLGPGYFSVTGILAGQTTPTTGLFSFYPEEHGRQCERLALLMMTKPGKYQLHISGVENSGEERRCKLVRVAP